MPPIYPFEIKKHHIFLRNLVRSKLQKFQKNCNVFCTLITNCKNIAKNNAKFLQFGRAIILEKNIRLFNFKGIYAWHSYGTRGFFYFNTKTAGFLKIDLELGST